VLDDELVGVAPVVEDLAALDVTTDAPRVVVALLAQVLASCGECVEVGDLDAEWRYLFEGPRRLCSRCSSILLCFAWL
jgi:hypothetical protein